MITSGRSLLTGIVVAHQRFNDMLRWNPHFHAIVLEGGFDDEGTFFYIRRYGLYASRTKGRWDDMPWVMQRAPEGWKVSHPPVSGTKDLGYEPLSESEEEVDIDVRKRAWAWLLAKVYEVDPLGCPKCGAEMKAIAIIADPDELKRVLGHFVKNGRSPHGFDPHRLS